jgi:hypothetical protein
MTFSILGTLESENLSLTFYAPDRSNKNVSRQDARLPARGQAKHVKKDPTVSFRPKGEIFLKIPRIARDDGLGPSPWRPLRLCARHVLKIRFLNEGSEGKNRW